MSSKPKEFNTTELTINFVREDDAGYSQDRYLPERNYVSQYRGVLSEPPTNVVLGDMFYDDGLVSGQTGLFIRSSFEYKGALVQTWAAATTYAKGEYVDNGGIAYKALQDFTSGGAFNVSNRSQVNTINTRLKA